MQTFSYHRPADIQALFTLMNQCANEYRLLAGGTDLLVRLKSGRISPKAIIDIKGIALLQEGIRRYGNSFVIGALTLMAEIESHQGIQQYFPALVEAVHTVGSVQIRNRASIAGNLCNASPAADSAPALLIYNAIVTCISRHGERQVPLNEFFVGPGRTVLAEDELVKEITLPIPSVNQAAAFTRLTRRKGVDLATINLCCQVNASGVTYFALGAVGPVPFIVEESEGILTSITTSAEEQKACIANLMEKASPISDVRASKEYRQAMLTVLGQRALATALQRLKASD
jgi:CO/xanthine dehydrogenase FAD-binding subunit